VGGYGARQSTRASSWAAVAIWKVGGFEVGVQRSIHSNGRTSMARPSLYYHWMRGLTAWNSGHSRSAQPTHRAPDQLTETWFLRFRNEGRSGLGLGLGRLCLD